MVDRNIMDRNYILSFMPKETKSKAKSAPKKKLVAKKATPKKKTPAKKGIDRKELDAAVELLRPALQSHGGDIEVVSLKGGEVKVRLQGACQSCPMAAVTLKQGVEKFLLKRVKGLKKVSAA
jgi:Fe-S cluster biogenesis protein NfuA